MVFQKDLGTRGTGIVTGITRNTDGTPNYTSAKYLVQKDPATITLADGSTGSGTLIETDPSAGFVYVDGTSSMVFQKDLGTRGTGIVTGITRNTDGTPNYTSRSEERRVGKESRSRWSPYH